MGKDLARLLAGSWPPAPNHKNNNSLLLQQLESLVRAHRWVPNQIRTNISRDVTIHRGRPCSQKNLKTNTLRSGPIVDLLVFADY